MRKEDVRAAFGRNAESYAISTVHAKGASLQRLVELSQPQPDWLVLDIATGAGHTAFAFSPLVRKVSATDMTLEMLIQTALGAEARGFKNIEIAFAEAESLPYPNDYFDLVTCRIAPHHFSDIGAFVRESGRVLQPGGVFAVVDNVIPEGVSGAYVNAFEKLRDISHGRCLSMPEWQQAIENAGLQIEHEETFRKQMSFNFWAQRHDTDTQSFLRAMLDLAAGEARMFLSPEAAGKDVVFYLEEGLIIARKATKV